MDLMILQDNDYIKPMSTWSKEKAICIYYLTVKKNKK